MKILIVGAFGSVQRDAAIMEGFRLSGCEVFACHYGGTLGSNKLISRMQFRLGYGPVFQSIQRQVIESAKQIKPDIIFFRRPLEFSSEMIQAIRKASGACLAAFNNDDPFSAMHKDVRWVKLRAAIPDYDIHFAFRKHNISQYKDFGAKHVALWEPSYVPWLHRPLVAEHAWMEQKSKVLFVMHAERDERREALHKLMINQINVDVHSWNWAEVFGKSDAKTLNVMPPIWEDDYVRAIGHAMATLCFFSKRNNDELTSRVFEIPACSGLLVSYRTDRVAEIFKDWEEAVFFNDADELLDILQFLAKKPDLVVKIRARGRERLLRSKCSVVDRCQDALNIFQELI